MITKKLGLKPSTPDSRDFKLVTIDNSIYKNIPKKRDNIAVHIPEVYDQLNSSSCTGNMWTMATRYALIIHKKPDLNLSRMFVYWLERFLEGSTNEDGGAQIRTGAKVLNEYGAPLEELWPFSMDNILIKPSADAYKNALENTSKIYMQVKQTLDELKLCIFEGYPICFGTDLTNDFMSEKVAETGIIPLPNWNRDEVVGGHAILIVGYDDSTRKFKVLNSWGKDWGQGGYCFMDYDYILNTDHTTDFWTLRTVEPKSPKREIIRP